MKMRYYGWSPMMHSDFGGFGIIGIVIAVSFWVLLFFLVFSLFKRSNKLSDYNGSSKALDILKERYAKGEINKKEFEEMKKDVE